MRPKYLWQLLIAAGLAALVGVLAVACGDEEEGATPTPGTKTPAATTAAPSPTPLRPGAAGIPSKPRDAKGLEGVITLDDGLAMFKQRPASEDRTGVTATTIKLGRTTGITGFLAAYEPGWGGILNAMIQRINDAGGIHGRKIELVTKDDASDPTVGVQVTKELIEGDKVFSLFFTIGSPTHNAVHDYHVQQKVPLLFYFDGTVLGQEPETSKWDFNALVPDIMTGYSMAQAVLKDDPNAKVAVVYGDFPGGQNGRQGILYALDAAGSPAAVDLSHDPTQVDLTAQAQQVDGSGADRLLYHGSITQSISLVNALRQTVGSTIPVMQWGWVPTGSEADALFDGSQQVTFFSHPFVHPNSPVWAKLQTLADEENVPYVPFLATQSLMVVEHLVRALELAGPDLTREGIVEALETGFDGSWKCSVCLAPAILGPQDHWANETYLVVQWDQAKQLFEILNTVGYETSEGKGIRGNIPGYECKANTCPWQQ